MILSMTRVHCNDYFLVDVFFELKLQLVKDVLVKIVFVNWIVDSVGC